MTNFQCYQSRIFRPISLLKFAAIQDLRNAFEIENCDYGKKAEDLITIINIKKEPDSQSQKVFENFKHAHISEVNDISTPYVFYMPKPYEKVKNKDIR